MPAEALSVPKQPLKRQIKQLHPSCSSGELKGLSNKGIRRVEAILGFFSQVSLRPRPFSWLLPPASCTIASPPRAPWPLTAWTEQALVQQMAGLALAHGLKTVTHASLMSPETGIENLKVPHRLRACRRADSCCEATC